MSEAIGATVWAFPAGRIPPDTSGREPEFTSRDELCILNAGAEEASLQITVVRDDQDPVGPYELSVGAQRVRRVRVNDLINPEAVPYDVPYGLILRADRAVVVQHLHVDSRRPEDSIFATLGHPTGG